MFALEMPARIPPTARLSSEYLVISLTPIRSRIRYEMSSVPQFQAASGGGPEELANAPRLPRCVNPRALALASEWRESLADPGAIVSRAIEFFRGGRFEYTLQPPRLGRNSVDEFLFNTRQGFCEHFASSFVFMMRAAGVPARVVTGYQGGDTIPVDGYMVVRQAEDRKSTRLNSSHITISYAVFCLKKKKQKRTTIRTNRTNTRIQVQ